MDVKVDIHPLLVGAELELAGDQSVEIAVAAVVFFKLQNVAIDHEGIENAADDVEKRPRTIDLCSQTSARGQLVLPRETCRANADHRAFADVEDDTGIV